MSPNLVCVQSPTHVAMHIPQVNGVHLHVLPSVRISGTAGQIALKFVVWLEINYAMRFTPLRSGVHLHVRSPFPYLGNGWADCAEIWYVVRNHLARQFT